MSGVLLLEGLSGALTGVCLLYLLAALLARRWHYPAMFYLAGLGFVAAG